MQEEFRKQLLSTVGSTIVNVEVTSTQSLQPQQEVILDLVDENLLLYSIKVVVDAAGTTTTRFIRPDTGTMISDFLGLIVGNVLITRQAILFATNGYYLELQLQERIVTTLTNREGKERWKILSH